MPEWPFSYALSGATGSSRAGADDLGGPYVRRTRLAHLHAGSPVHGSESAAVMCVTGPLVSKEGGPK